MVRSRLARVVVGTVLSLAGAVVLVAVTHAATGVPTVDLLTDVTAVGGLTPWAGGLSTLGLLGWCAAAVALGIAAWVRRQDGHGGPSARYLAEAAVLVGLVLIDDAYLLHEDVIPRAFGIHEYVVYGVYAVVAAGWGWRWRRQLRAAPASLIVAILALGASVVADAVGPVKELLEVLPVHTLVVEELFKLAGIGAVVVFAGGEVRAAVHQAVGRRAAAPRSLRTGAVDAPGGGSGAGRPVAVTRRPDEPAAAAQGAGRR